MHLKRHRRIVATIPRILLRLAISAGAERDQGRVVTGLERFVTCFAHSSDARVIRWLRAELSHLSRSDQVDGTRTRISGATIPRLNRLDYSPMLHSKRVGSEPMGAVAMPSLVTPWALAPCSKVACSVPATDGRGGSRTHFMRVMSPPLEPFQSTLRHCHAPCGDR